MGLEWLWTRPEGCSWEAGPLLRISRWSLRCRPKVVDLPTASRPPLKAPPSALEPHGGGHGAAGLRHFTTWIATRDLEAVRQLARHGVEMGVEVDEHVAGPAGGAVEVRAVVGPRAVDRDAHAT